MNPRCPLCKHPTALVGTFQRYVAFLCVVCRSSLAGVHTPVK